MTLSTTKNAPAPRLGKVAALLTLAAAAGLSLATGVAGPASAATKFDGTWTLDHAGTGQVVFNGDYTYASTCQKLPTFPLANCPAPVGTFAINGAYVSLTGSNGTSVALRMSGPVGAPTGLSAIQPYYNGLILDRGATFKCSTFYDSTYAFAKGPLATTNADRTQAFALGSNQALGARSAANYVFLAETAPGYFVKGNCP